jgi:hypothetical protein
MTTINCEDRVFVDTDFRSFGNELYSKHAKLQTPVNCSKPQKSKNGIVYILVLDPVIEFDDTLVPKADIEAIMTKYKIRERP